MSLYAPTSGRAPALIKATGDESVADEEWLNKYHKEENERLEAEQKFLRRFDGSLEISEW